MNFLFLHPHSTAETGEPTKVHKHPVLRLAQGLDFCSVILLVASCIALGYSQSPVESPLQDLLLVASMYGIVVTVAGLLLARSAEIVVRLLAPRRRQVPLLPAASDRASVEKHAA